MVGQTISFPNYFTVVMLVRLMVILGAALHVRQITTQILMLVKISTTSGIKKLETENHVTYAWQENWIKYD